MTETLQLITQYGVGFAFANVLIEQLGAPIPAYPTLLLMGAMLSQGKYSATFLFAATLVAAILADYVWYYIGRRYGQKTMGLLCRISLSPDSCVRQMQSVYTRLGPASLIVAKFVPGFSTFANVLAGTTKTKPSVYLLFSGLGSVIWVGSAILLGDLFSSVIDELLNVLADLGKYGIALLAAALVIYVAQKWWQRQRFLHTLRMARISVDELHRLLQAESPPVIVDVRPVALQKAGRIPGALAVPDKGLDILTLEMPMEREVILYCSCPNEASAALVAKQLMRKGYQKVRPLAGGIEAWIEAGHLVEV